MSNKNTSLSAVIYVRVSSEKQIDNYSLDIQEKITSDYAKSNHMKILKVFREEGKSGRNTNRPAYQEMKKFLLETKVDVVLVHKLDRLHRDEYNLYADLHFFQEHGIKLIAIADGIDSSNNDLCLAIAMQSAISANFSRNLSKETRKGLLAGAENCQHMGGKPPYGFKVNHDTGLLEIDEVTAPAVKQIFQLYADDFSAGEICKWLKEHGYKTNNGNDFKANSLNSILHNEKYRGCYTWDKSTPKDSEGHRNGHAVKDNYTKIEGGCPAIISENLFSKVQKRLVINRNKASRSKPKRYYPLNGKIFCAECGSKMTGNVQYSKNHRYYQYRCSEKCGNRPIRAEPLENSIFQILRQCLFSEPNQQAVLDTLNANAKAQKQDNDTLYQQLKAKASGLETAQNNLLKAIESGKATTAIMNRLERISNEKIQLDAKTENLHRTVRTFTNNDLSELQKSLAGYLQTSDTINNKKLLNSTINRIDVSNNEVQVTLAEGIAVDRKTKNLFIKKEYHTMMIKNDVNEIKIEGILLNVVQKDEETFRLFFVMRDKTEIGYTGNSDFDVSVENFYGIAEEAECDILSLVGSKFEMVFETINGEFTDILELTKVA